jgi:hypothetical protein
MRGSGPRMTCPQNPKQVVKAGRVPAIHVNGARSTTAGWMDVDARNTCGHDAVWARRPYAIPPRQTYLISI